MVGKPYLEEIMAASHTGFIVLMSKYMIACARKYQTKGIAYSLDPLAGLTADFDRIIHRPFRPAV